MTIVQLLLMHRERCKQIHLIFFVHVSNNLVCHCHLSPCQRWLEPLLQVELSFSSRVGNVGFCGSQRKVGTFTTRSPYCLVIEGPEHS
jgi:hypothetical protein